MFPCVNFYSENRSNCIDTDTSSTQTSHFNFIYPMSCLQTRVTGVKLETGHLTPKGAPLNTRPIWTLQRETIT